ncbi:class I SAM-dependent methyltransferase [Aliiglaciecola sp. CAU 1673]|uniref:class I SAM-dependent methyltransferase n=1 Tax=Aliiglaciecola sp. CAU 1673 TaxID=3032595 RepID=UPI0023D9E04C|nr:class I SAM-dependent methyltransferase [Aliiglaciecola sp. CAU 1673]MDF2176920.1 class I SAM-dependent methyltransferase [Aliiglaciecola sp. CAU 1673]
MAATAKFWDRIADKYSRQPIANMPAYEHKLAKTRAYFRPDSQVLELGCGTGSTALLHAPFVGHILATDISPKMLGIARAKAEEEGIDNVHFELASVDDLNPREPLDVVMAMSLLHLLEDKEALIAKVYKWLKPGGVFITSTVCLQEGMNWLRWIAPIGYKLGLMPYVSFFSGEHLANCLTRAGFELDYQWRPKESKMTLFIVAKKPE